MAKRKSEKEDPEVTQFRKDNRGGTKAREKRELKAYVASPQGAELKQYLKEKREGRWDKDGNYIRNKGSRKKVSSTSPQATTKSVAKKKTARKKVAVTK